MKNITFIIPLAIFALMASTGFALAQERTTAERPTLQERLNEKRDTLLEKEDVEKRREATVETQEATTRVQGEAEERRVAAEEKAAQQQTQAQEKRAQALEGRILRIEALILRMGSRLGAATERLQILSERILSRVEKFEERGVDMQSVRNLLTTAGDTIIDAKNAVADIPILVTTISESLRAGETPADALASLREAVKGAVEKIRTAHRALVEAVVELKDAASEEDEGNEGDDEEENENSTE
ncbi:MAG: hypothetical protein WD003_02380 [Candidatus Paceibacterota bacterium]